MKKSSQKNNIEMTKEKCTNLTKLENQRLIDILESLKKETTNRDKDINEIISFIKDRKYGLYFEKHIEQVDIDCEKNFLGFVEDVEKKIEVDKSLPYNFLLEGDNLHSLKLLEKTHIKNGKGLIDVIYIDPPYNTKNKDFIYNDKIIGEDDAYRHSKWLSFMETRLKIAYDLLKDDGLILISIDDNEFANLKLLCDDIFGEENMLSTHHIQVRYENKSLNEKNDWQPIMEYVLIYAKYKKIFKANKQYENYSIEKFKYKIIELTNGADIELGGKKAKVFKKGEYSIKECEPNNELFKETWASGSVIKGNASGKFCNEYICDRKEIDGLECLYKVYGIGIDGDGLGYRYFTGPKKENTNRGKFYTKIPLNRLDEIENKSINNSKKYKPIINYYNYSPDFGNIKHEGGIGFNSGKKPIKMLKEFINYHTNKDAIVLDFFAGSGTTGHAVLELNKEDGGNRKFILCTNNENNICEDITYQRLKTVITGIRQDGSQYSESLPTNLKYFKTSLIDKNDDDLEDKLEKTKLLLKELGKE